MAERDQSFDNFQQWVNKASSWLTRHPQYLNTEHPRHADDKGWRGQHFTAICFDSAGRLCRNGADMMRARDEGCFPVRWVWPDQIPEMERSVRLSEGAGSQFSGRNLADANSENPSAYHAQKEMG